MQKRVLFITTNAYPFYNKTFCDSFKKLGFSVKMISIVYGIRKLDFVSRLKLLFGKFDSDSFYANQRVKNSEFALNIFRKFMPNYVFVNFGLQISKEFIIEVSSKSCTILNLTDSHKKYPGLKEVIGAYDYVLSYDNDDSINHYSKKNYIFFPGTYDEKVYKDLGIIKKDIDISFVGSMYGFRKEILERLCQDFSTFRIVIYGKYQSKNRIIGYLKFIFSTKRRNFKNKIIKPLKVNKIYNRSKIVLNLEHSQAENGFSSRLVEILGSGAFQLVTSREIIKDIFGNGVVMFSDYNDLVDKIKKYLLDYESRSSISSNGHRIVDPYYTNYYQIEKLFNFIDNKI